MSLIVDALKRAQEGAARRLPPLAGRGVRSPFPGLGLPSDRRGSRWRLAAASLLVLGLAGTGIWFARDYVIRQTPRATAPRVIVTEPVVIPGDAERPGAVPAEPATADAAGVAAPGRDAAASRSAGRPRRPSPPPLVSTAPAVPLLRAPIPPTAPPTPATVQLRVFEVEQGGEALSAGLGEHQRGDLPKAIEQYRRGIESDPRNPGLFNNLGLALKESGNLDEAAQAFAEALKLDPKYEKALNNLGVTRYEQGRFEDAIDYFKRAIGINPGNAQSYINLGIIYLPAGRSDEALSMFQDALRYDPRSPEAHYNLALLWERRGDRNRAQQYYEKFVELTGSSNPALAERVKDHLRQFETRR